MVFDTLVLVLLTSWFVIDVFGLRPYIQDLVPRSEVEAADIFLPPTPSSPGSLKLTGLPPGKKVELLNGLVQERGTTKLTEWEIKFISSVQKQQRWSKRSVEKLDEIIVKLN